MCEMLFRVNHFAADKGKISISRDDPFVHVCRFPHNLFANDFVQFFNTVLFCKSSSTRCKSDVIQ